MKKYTFLPIILLSLFLLNCGSVTTTTPDTPQKLIDSVKNKDLQEAMKEFPKTKKLRDVDTLLLALDESANEETQIEYVRYFINHGKVPLQAIYAVLFKAAVQNKPKIMRSVLNEVPVDDKMRDSEDRSLLHHAVIYSTPEMIDYLRLKGFSSNTESKLHGTPLHYVIAAPFKLDNKNTNDPAARKIILGILIQDRKINLKLKNPANETPEDLAHKLEKTSTDPSHKAFYTWAENKLKERKKTKMK